MSNHDCIRLFLAGDVMTGRGIDQILRNPGDPELYEPWVRSAHRYVELAERESGTIPRRAPGEYIWGDALARLDQARPDVRIVNLETAVTDTGSAWPGKGIHYRMHPANLECLTQAGIHIASLANNHVMDWGVPGLLQTLDALGEAGVRVTGAGRNEDEAWQPATLEVGRRRVVVIGVGMTSSGIPAEWAADADRPGVAILPSFDRGVDKIAPIVSDTKYAGDVVVVSIHWGGNWGYSIPNPHRRFAQALVDRAGVDVVHGHSSHHPLGIEVYRGRLILYGCGDLITDYEGITGHEEFRGDLGAMYLPSVDPTTGRLRHLALLPTTIEKFRLIRPTERDTRLLADTLDRESHPFGVAVTVGAEGALDVDWT